MHFQYEIQTKTKVSIHILKVLYIFPNKFKRYFKLNLKKFALKIKNSLSETSEHIRLNFSVNLILGFPGINWIIEIS